MDREQVAPIGLAKTSEVRLCLLGGSRIERLGLPVRLPTRKTQSLLAYLALHPAEHSRERLAALFWGDSTDQEARHSLRAALAALRTHLGESVLLADREIVQITSDCPIWVDALEFEACARRALATQPPDPSTIDLDLYQGDLLPDLYDDWVLNARERYRQLYFDLLLHLAQHWRTQGEYRRVIDLANRILTQDPANEDAHRHLMFSHFALHDRHAALKQYEACVRSLRDELGVEPSAETQALYNHIRSSPPPEPSRTAYTNNLPIPLTSFIGRERDAAELERLLMPEEEPGLPPTRLLTLTGPGGCGKTRLAIRVADDLAERYRDGVWWVDLAPLTDDERVLDTVARTVGVVVQEQEAIEETLIRNLRRQHILLVWDNCEHRIAACARLAATLLAQCPTVQILATSREAMGLFGETAWLLPALSLPLQEAPQDPGMLMQYESIRLFVERATAIRGGFALTAANAPAIVQICGRLDGMPLAIELAAARTKSMGVVEIAERLIRRFDLLSVGNTTAPKRQQTLAATIDWSYDLLSDAERTLLRRLAVFANGCTLEAAEAVTAGDGIERGQVLDLLARLVDKSLVQVVEQERRARYHMLETIREYSGDKLREAGEAEDVQRRHCLFFMELAETAEPNLRRAGQVEWLRRLDADYDNLRAAMTWSLVRSAEPDLTWGLRTAAALAAYWSFRSSVEGRDMLIDLLAATDAAPTPERARALYGLGELAVDPTDSHLARTALEQSIHMFDALKDLSGAAYARQSLAFFHFVYRETELAYELWDACARYFRSAGDTWGLARTLITRARAARDSGDLEAAYVYLYECGSLFSALGDRANHSIVVSHLGLLAYKRKDYQTARAGFERRIAVARELADEVLEMIPTLFLGHTAIAEGQFSEAAGDFKRVLNLARRYHFNADLVHALRGLAMVAARRQATGQATRLWAARQGLIDAEVRPFFYPAVDVVDVDEGREITDLRARLGEAEFDVAWNEGSNMDLDQAIEEALAI